MILPYFIRPHITAENDFYGLWGLTQRKCDGERRKPPPVRSLAHFEKLETLNDKLCVEIAHLNMFGTKFRLWKFNWRKQSKVIRVVWQLWVGRLAREIQSSRTRSEMKIEFKWLKRLEKFSFGFWERIPQGVVEVLGQATENWAYEGVKWQVVKF